jgi:hypothetical protein
MSKDPNERRSGPSEPETPETGDPPPWRCYASAARLTRSGELAPARQDWSVEGAP